MKKFAVAIAEEGEDLLLELVEASSKEDAAFRFCDRRGLFDDCEEEDNPRPESLGDLHEFLENIGAQLQVVEIPDSAPRAVRMGE